MRRGPRVRTGPTELGNQTQGRPRRSLLGFFAGGQECNTLRVMLCLAFSLDRSLSARRLAEAEVAAERGLDTVHA